ncbi:M3 family oligoendopeptidase [Mycoplasmopsis opalescens]|uniref:M3 family oligoendopeptidase n=1 Tax=Mycoplasmopsis opalescens TaxID=114886 RepID=UPI0004A75479|nr:M3 family oligoendopeptidase [Mycoplasmopsis opalescens]
MKQYKNLKEVPTKYQFDLESILEGKKIEDWIALYEAKMRVAIANKDSKYETLDAYLADLKLNSEIEIITNKISNYISNNLNRELTSEKYNKLSYDFSFLNQKLSDELGSEHVRLVKNIDKLRVWKNDERMKNYRNGIEMLELSIKHKLSDEIEEYLVKTSIADADFHEVFSLITDSELDYGFVTDKKGKKINLSPAVLEKYSKSDDKNVRHGTIKNKKKAYLNHKASLASLLFQHFQTIVQEAKIRKYNSAVEMLTFSDRVDDKILQKLFEKVASLKHATAKYSKWHKKFYEAKYKEKFDKKYDGARELVKIKNTFSVEDAQKIILEAFKPYGDEYYRKIKEAFDTNWVDYMTIDNKRSGAYSIGESYGLDKKYILMNWNDQLSSVETLAHELGHSMHSYYSDKNNPIELSKYPIFLAEIASIFNEQMLFDYLLKTSNDDKFKFKILQSMIDGFFGTVSRQVKWANYEYDLYNAIAKGEASPSYDSLAKIYFEALKKYSIKYPKYNKDDQFGCIYVPHYYYGFYVYKYAIGQLVANYFYQNYLDKGKEYLQYYIENFLSSGCRDFPIKILESIGVDLSSDKFYEIGFNYINGLIDKYIEIGKKLFKIN